MFGGEEYARFFYFVVSLHPSNPIPVVIITKTKKKTTTTTTTTIQVGSRADTVHYYQRRKSSKSSSLRKGVLHACFGLDRSGEVARAEKASEDKKKRNAFVQEFGSSPRRGPITTTGA